MGPRNLLILFFSTVAVSLVILIIFFSLFFKNVNLDFNTRLPESAPDIGSRFNANSTMNPESKADGLMRSTVNVPPEMKEPEGGIGKNPEKAANLEKEPGDADLPPVSDDALLENDFPQPLPEKLPPAEKTAVSDRTGVRQQPPQPRMTRPTERHESLPSMATPSPIEDSASQQEEPASGPPVPQ